MNRRYKKNQMKFLDMQSAIAIAKVETEPNGINRGLDPRENLQDLKTEQLFKINHREEQQQQQQPKTKTTLEKKGQEEKGSRGAEETPAGRCSRSISLERPSAGRDRDGNRRDTGEELVPRGCGGINKFIYFWNACQSMLPFAACCLCAPLDISLRRCKDVQDPWVCGHVDMLRRSLLPMSALDHEHKWLLQFHTLRASPVSSFPGPG